MTIEDGTGLALANAYVSAVNADTYFSDRNITEWTGVVAVKESAIIRASQYLDGFYRKRWKGTRLNQDQGLAWPRLDVYDEDEFLIENVPQQVVYATCEAALLIIKGEDLTPSLERGGKVRREKVSTALETEFEPGAPARNVLTIIDDLLSGLTHGHNSVKIVRV